MAKRAAGTLNVVMPIMAMAILFGWKWAMGSGVTG